MITIRTIRLLDRGDYEAFRSKVPRLSKNWLLSSPSYTGEVLLVDNYGDIVTTSISRIQGVRPAALLTIEEHDIKAEDKVNLFGMEWTVFSVCEDSVWVLCDDLIAQKSFNKPGGGNKWETSTIKTWLEEWIEYAVMGLEDEVVYEPLTVGSFLREAKPKVEKIENAESTTETWTSMCSDEDYKSWWGEKDEKVVREEIRRILKKQWKI